MIKWKRKPHGNCPVQAEGYFMGYYFYFRSRWNEAVIEFSKTEAGWDNDLIHARYILLDTEDEYAAGWLPKWICRLLIWKGCLKFLFKKGKVTDVNLSK
jgi:hypothetical protein